MPLTRSELMQRLAAMGVTTLTIDHPPSFTVADNDSHGLDIPGAHTKNLFLKDEKGPLVLVVAQTDTKVDLKGLAKRLGLSRFSFGKPDLLMTHLGVTPGAVTAFAIANDVDRRVRLVFDQALMASATINLHPLENTATTNIARDDLLRFIRETGHDPEVMYVSAV